MGLLCDLSTLLRQETDRFIAQKPKKGPVKPISGVLLFGRGEAPS